ncbi:MAG: ABC transporter permease, partial [Rikenellaceae bacterium]
MSALKLIITKEFNQRVKKKSFIISTLIAPLFFAFMMVAPALLVTYGTDNESTASNIMVVDKTDSIGRELHSGDAVKYDLKNISEDDGKEIVKNSASYQALLVIQPNDQFLLYTKQQLSIQTLDIINSNVTDIVRQHKIKSYDIKNIDAIIADINLKIDMKSYKLTEEGEKKVSNAVPIATGFIFSILIYMFILMYGNQVSMSVIDEKSSRVVELIVSQVKPFWLMMGKIIGIGLVGLTQFVIWMGLSLIISSIVKSVIMPDIDITQLSSSTDALRQAGISDSM